MRSFCSAFWKISPFLLILPLLVLFAGCSSTAVVQATPGTSTATPSSTTPTAVVSQVTPTPTATPAQPVPTPTPQTGVASYVGKWEVHDSLLTINTNNTGVEQWNSGPCEQQMCNGNAQVLFTTNSDGSITGTIQSVTYTQWNSDPAPAGFQPDPSDPQAGDTFQLQHSGPHLLYTTWLGTLSSLNSGNRYWCDTYAQNAGWKQCGA